MQRDKFKKTYTHKNNKQTHTEKRQKLKTRTHISQVITISIKNWVKDKSGKEKEKKKTRKKKVNLSLESDYELCIS